METGKALKQYFESVEQFTDYYKSKINEIEQKHPSSPVKTSKIPPLKNNNL